MIPHSPGSPPYLTAYACIAASTASMCWRRLGDCVCSCISCKASALVIGFLFPELAPGPNPGLAPGPDPGLRPALTPGLRPALTPGLRPALTRACARP